MKMIVIITLMPMYILLELIAIALLPSQCKNNIIL